MAGREPEVRGVAGELARAGAHVAVAALVGVACLREPALGDQRGQQRGLHVPRLRLAGQVLGEGLQAEGDGVGVLADPGQVPHLLVGVAADAVREPVARRGRPRPEVPLRCVAVTTWWATIQRCSCTACSPEAGVDVAPFHLVEHGEGLLQTDLREEGHRVDDRLVAHSRERRNCTTAPGRRPGPPRRERRVNESRGSPPSL